MEAQRAIVNAILLAYAAGMAFGVADSLLLYRKLRAKDDADVRRQHVKASALAGLGGVFLFFATEVPCMAAPVCSDSWRPHWEFYPVVFAVLYLMYWVFFGENKAFRDSWARKRLIWLSSQERLEWIEWAKRQPEILTWSDARCADERSKAEESQEDRVQKGG